MIIPIQNGFWTERYQAAYLAQVCQEVIANDDIVGVSLWQFHDIRTYHGPRAVNRARSFNNKGTLDEYRRPKLAYSAVREVFRASEETERPAGPVRAPRGAPEALGTADR